MTDQAEFVRWLDENMQGTTVEPIAEAVMQEPDFQLRLASDADLDAFYGFYVRLQSIHLDAEPEFFRQSEKDEEFQQYFEGILSDPDQHILFACLDEVAVGFIMYFLGLRHRSIFQPERRVGYIHGLAVNEAQRRKGCAAMLIDYVKQAARNQDIALLGVDFWSFNEGARACYEKAGFKVSREFMWLGL